MSPTRRVINRRFHRTLSCGVVSSHSVAPLDCVELNGVGQHLRLVLPRRAVVAAPEAGKNGSMNPQKLESLYIQIKASMKFDIFLGNLFSSAVFARDIPRLV